MRSSLDLFLEGEMDSYTEAGMIDLDYFSINCYGLDLGTGAYVPDPYRAFNKTIDKYRKKVSPEEEYIEYLYNKMRKKENPEDILVHIEYPKPKALFNRRRKTTPKPAQLKFNVPADFVVEILEHYQKYKRRPTLISIKNEYTRHLEYLKKKKLSEEKEMKKKQNELVYGRDFDFIFKVSNIIENDGSTNKWRVRIIEFRVTSLKNRYIYASFYNIFDNELLYALEQFEDKVIGHIRNKKKWLNKYRRNIIEDIISSCMRPIIFNYNNFEYYIRIEARYRENGIKTYIGLADRSDFKFVNAGLSFQRIDCSHDDTIRNSIQKYLDCYNLGECPSTFVDGVKEWYNEVLKMMDKIYEEGCC